MLVSILAGVVSGVAGPRLTGGPDLLLSVTLSDPTCVDGVCFNVFRSSAASFPQLRVGDIVRVHRCAVQMYAAGKVGGTVREKTAQFVCCRGHEEETGHAPLDGEARREHIASKRCLMSSTPDSPAIC